MKMLRNALRIMHCYYHRLSQAGGNIVCYYIMYCVALVTQINTLFFKVVYATNKKYTATRCGIFAIFCLIKYYPTFKHIIVRSSFGSAPARCSST